MANIFLKFSCCLMNSLIWEATAPICWVAAEKNKKMEGKESEEDHSYHWAWSSPCECIVYALVTLPATFYTWASRVETRNRNSTILAIVHTNTVCVCAWYYTHLGILCTGVSRRAASVSLLHSGLLSCDAMNRANLWLCFSEAWIRIVIIWDAHIVFLTTLSITWRLCNACW